jgi:hypothetical protein
MRANIALVFKMQILSKKSKNINSVVGGSSRQEARPSATLPEKSVGALSLSPFVDHPCQEAGRPHKLN